MSRRAPACHIGIAFSAVPNFSTQWTLVLSESPLFEGFVWCGTISETVNGFGASWATCNSSLTAFNPMAKFLGVIHVAQSSTSISTTKSMIPLENIASEINRSPALYPHGSENYVALALLRLCEAGSIKLIDEKPQSIYNTIRYCLTDLKGTRPQASQTYPVISLDHARATRT